MAAIPNSALMAKSLRQKQRNKKEQQNQSGKAGQGIQYNAQQESANLGAQQYSSKMMNSIWGMYNKHSVHNLKALKTNEPRDEPAAAAHSSSASKDLNRFFNQYNMSERPTFVSPSETNYTGMQLKQLGNAVAANLIGPQPSF